MIMLYQEYPCEDDEYSDEQMEEIRMYEEMDEMDEEEEIRVVLEDLRNYPLDLYGNKHRGMDVGRWMTISS